MLLINPIQLNSIGIKDNLVLKIPTLSPSYQFSRYYDFFFELEKKKNDAILSTDALIIFIC